jgi:DivIVA domain-containing protein
VDRDAIERRDFPVGRRGYDPAAVDAHLRAVADEMDGLRRRAAAPQRQSPGLAAGASERVREILEAAERSAAEIRDQAGRDASEHVGRVTEAAAAMLSRLDQLQGELDGLLAGLRHSGEALASGLARLQEDVRDMRPDDPEPAPAPPPPAAPGPPAPEPIPEPPVAPAPDEPEELEEPISAPAGDDAGARLIVLNMALGGTPRDEAARYLAEHFELSDPGGLLDDVYSRVGGPGT